VLFEYIAANLKDSLQRSDDLFETNQNSNCGLTDLEDSKGMSVSSHFDGVSPMLTTVEALSGQIPLREEKDLLGKGPVPLDALYGIHTQRAIENFPIAKRPVHSALIHAFGMIKGAAATTNRAIGAWPENNRKAEAIIRACEEMGEGLLDRHMAVDALQGGAGTSTNMNANEVLANRALQLLNLTLGDYLQVSPLEDINLHQSTNDAFPSALKLAAIRQLENLVVAIRALESSFRTKEKAFAHIVKIGRTQLQDAVLITLGREMKAYAEALARDATRLEAAKTSLYTLNLGGTAIGTGIAAPRAYIEKVVPTLAQMTNLPLKQAEDLVDGTQNLDVFAEVSGALKSCATTMIKISNDLRLMSSGPDGGLAELRLPPRQAGSSIMPGKVNPVIPEALTQAAFKMIGYDQTICLAVASGNLELNAFLPLVADCLLDGMDIMTNAITIMRLYCVDGLEANEERCHANIEGSTAILTALVPVIGYGKSMSIVHDAQEQGKSVRQTAIEKGYMDNDSFDVMISADAVNRLGSS
jgi:aspartate ammonia-lyase